MGSSSVVAYLAQLLKGQEPCFRLKLMFVGQENVGYVVHLRSRIATRRSHRDVAAHVSSKTSLLRALQRRERRIKSVMARQGDVPDASTPPLDATGDEVVAINVSDITRTRTHARTRTRTGTPPLSTDGIEINSWSLSMYSVWGADSAAVDLSAWDFAGQEIYYATHQFFLSERSLFLVVFNLVSPVESRIEYW
jgi:hypothetical protein